MKTIVRIVLLALAAHALIRFVPPYYHHHQFRMELQRETQVWGERSDEEVMQAVLAAAARNKVPITRKHVTVRQADGHVLIDVAYDVLIEWIPTVKKPWTFSFHLDAWRLSLSLPTPPGR